MGYPNIPVNDLSNPIIMEVYDMKWDFDCLFDATFEGCPTMSFVWGGSGINACWRIELQMATDGTKDIPR